MSTRPSILTTSAKGLSPLSTPPPLRRLVLTCTAPARLVVGPRRRWDTARLPKGGLPVLETACQFWKHLNATTFLLPMLLHASLFCPFLFATPFLHLFPRRRRLQSSDGGVLPDGCQFWKRPLMQQIPKTGPACFLRGRLQWMCKVRTIKNARSSSLCK